jgi:hypothetical protein
MRATACLLALLLGTTAAADIVSETIEDIELTVYRDPNRNGDDELTLADETDGIAMITETRTIDIPAGAATIRFRGVADGIVPQTATLGDLPATIVEANFDYNLLTPGTLIEKSLGRPVRLVRTNRATGAVEEQRGVLASGPDGVVVDFGNSVEALNCSGLAERMVFDDVPAGLADTPTLSLAIRAPTAGRYRMQLSYLALGMDWSADYIATLHSDGQRMSVSGWITLVNRYGSRFSNAKTHVVAGKLAREEAETLAPEANLPTRADRCWPIGDFRLRRKILEDRMFKRSQSVSAMGGRFEEVIVTGGFIARQSQLGDYKLYTLPFATTVEPRQLKQARLLEQPAVKVVRSYEYRVPDGLLDDAEPAPHNASVVLSARNTQRDGLGLPLPAGKVRVMETTSSGREYYVGEHAIEDTPLDLPLRLLLGESNDVTATPRLIEDSDSEDSQHERKRAIIEIDIANAGTRAAEVEVRQARELFESTIIARESRRHRVDGADYVWNVKVGARKRAVLRYTLEQVEMKDDE